MKAGITKGIILAGGEGSRLYPLTNIVCKQLLPVYNKPMVYYPLSTLMQLGLRDILLISTPKDLASFKNLLGNGNRLGLTISYAIQEHPEGIAQAFIIGKEFIGRDNVTLILGDNIFYGVDSIAKHALKYKDGAMIFGYQMKSPQRYGVIGFNESGNPDSIEEKPIRPKSNYAVTGLYLYDNNVVSIAESLKPSQRGELEITDINNYYLSKKKLCAVKLESGIGWLDTGTFDSLIEAGNYIATIEKRQGIIVGSIEEAAYKMGFIDSSQLKKITEQLPDNDYRQYLCDLIGAANDCR
ncbi:MAG: glucose-1-phosphate thymidylyltransferase RfbA [Candidatus Zixiibacteriota bacterium]